MKRILTILAIIMIMMTACKKTTVEPAPVQNNTVINDTTGTAVDTMNHFKVTLDVTDNSAINERFGQVQAFTNNTTGFNQLFFTWNKTSGPYASPFYDEFTFDANKKDTVQLNYTISCMYFLGYLRIDNTDIVKLRVWKNNVLIINKTGYQYQDYINI